MGIIDENRINGIRKTLTKSTRKEMTITYGFLFIILIFFPLIIFLLDFNIWDYLYSLLVMALLSIYVIVIPRVIVLSTLVYRTKYTGFLLELTLSLVLFFYFNIGTIILFYIRNFGSILLNNDYFFFVIFFNLTSLFGMFFLSKLIKKPIFWNTDITKENYLNNLLVQESALISDSMDGYSKRPFYSKFSETVDLIPSAKEFMIFMNDYSDFLARKGEILGIKTSDNKFTIFLRLTFRKPTIYKIKANFQLIFDILKKKNLSSITFSYSSKEIFISINEQDYDVLEDVTFHTLANNILDKIKISVDHYYNKNFTKAYTSLFHD